MYTLQPLNNRHSVQWVIVIKSDNITFIVLAEIKMNKWGVSKKIQRVAQVAERLDLTFKELLVPNICPFFGKKKFNIQYFLNI